MLYIKKIRNFKVNNPFFIYALGGGMGNVAELVGKELIKQKKAKKIYEILSDSMIDRVYTTKEGIIEAFKYEIYLFKEKNKDFIIFYGKEQPIDIFGRYELSNKITSFAKNIKCKEIISIGGFGVELEPKDPLIYLAGSSQKVIKKYEDFLKKKEIKYKIYAGGEIAGVSGLLVAFAKHKDMDSILLLSETYPTNQIYGFLGAKKILEILNLKFNLKIDVSELEKKGLELRENIEKKIGSFIHRPTTQSKDIHSKMKKDPYYFG